MDYTDIHSHIISGVDDGAVSIEQSELMLERAYGEGIRTIIATPHFGIRNADFDSETFRNNFQELADRAAARWPDLKLHMGSEIYFGPGTFKGLEEGKAFTLADSGYVLVEFPFVTDFDEIYHGIRKFLIEGYIPIIAHVERYAQYIGKLRNLELLVVQGALVQMNCSTVTEQWEQGFMGKRSWPIKAIKAGMVHFIASDCHDADMRPPEMKKAAAYLTEIAGREAAEKILRDNPRQITG